MLHGKATIQLKSGSLFIFVVLYMALPTETVYYVLIHVGKIAKIYFDPFSPNHAPPHPHQRGPVFLPVVSRRQSIVLVVLRPTTPRPGSRREYRRFPNPDLLKTWWGCRCKYYFVSSWMRAEEAQAPAYRLPTALCTRPRVQRLITETTGRATQLYLNGYIKSGHSIVSQRLHEERLANIN